MCPACITTMALMIAGATSTGGLGVLVARKFRAKTGAKDGAPQSQPTETGPCRTTESCLETSGSLRASSI